MREGGVGASGLMRELGKSGFWRCLPDVGTLSLRKSIWFFGMVSGTSRWRIGVATTDEGFCFLEVTRAG